MGQEENHNENVENLLIDKQKKKEEKKEVQFANMAILKDGNIERYSLLKEENNDSEKYSVSPHKSDTKPLRIEFAVIEKERDEQNITKPLLNGDFVEHKNKKKRNRRKRDKYRDRTCSNNILCCFFLNHC